MLFERYSSDPNILQFLLRFCELVYVQALQHRSVELKCPLVTELELTQSRTFDQA